MIWSIDVTQNSHFYMHLFLCISLCSLITYVDSCDHDHSQNTGQFISWISSVALLESIYLSCLSASPLAMTNLFFIPKFCHLWMLHKWNDTVYRPYRLAFVIWHNFLSDQVIVYISSLFFWLLSSVVWYGKLYFNSN